MYENKGKDELTKKDKVNRFLFKCGVVLNDKPVEGAPDMERVLSELQYDCKYDAVLAVINYTKYGIDRKLDAISYIIGVNVDDIPSVLRHNSDGVNHDATVNVWDYILRIARRDDWRDYTIESYEEMED